MDDLIERLRNYDGSGTCLAIAPVSTAMLDEAADEIERLRTLAKAWEESRNQRVIEHLKDKEEIERLRMRSWQVNCELIISRDKHENAIAEIERLRAALKDILHGYTTHGLDAFALNRGEYECDTCCKYIVPKMRVLRDIAFAALEDSDER